MTAASVLHVVVGHGLPVSFLNAVRSLQAAAPGDAILVIDNASPDEALRAELGALAAADSRLEVVLRSENDVRSNAKVGSLYTAYALAFARAVAAGYDLVHVLQGDMQTLWWDDEAVDRALALFEAHPTCVNVATLLLPRDRQLTDELEASKSEGVLRLRKYGLTDTGLFHLGRWAALGCAFGTSEREHAGRFLEAGFEVLCHPWPTDAWLPWPAVVRNGTQVGKEVRSGAPFLLRPLGPEAVHRVKAATGPVWLEDACVPWGWTCLTPMWTTGLDTLDYWVLRYRDARRNGLAHVLPRLDRRGAEGAGRPWWQLPFRPPLGPLLLGPFVALARARRAARARPA